MLGEKYLTKALLPAKLNRFNEVSVALAVRYEHLFVALVKELHQKGQSQQLREVLERHKEVAELTRMPISPNFILHILNLMEQGKEDELVELLSEDYEGPSHEPSWQRHLVS